MAESILGNRTKLLRRASVLRITTQSLAVSMQNGCFRSAYRGQGIEFSGVRDYIRGDDVRSIDWNVTSRMGKPFVKIFEEERELQIFIIIDRSLSMHSGTKGRSKLQTATELGTLLALAAEHNSNPVGAVLFNGEIEFSVAPKSGQNQTMLLLSRFDSYPEKDVLGSALDKAITGAYKVLKKRSLVFVISDFRVSGWEDSFAKLAKKHDVAAFRITDPADLSLLELGTVPFIDTETFEKRTLPTNSKMFRAAWYEEGRRRITQWSDSCLKRGGFPLSISTTDEPLTMLMNFFSQRQA